MAVPIEIRPEIKAGWVKLAAQESREFRRILKDKDNCGTPLILAPEVADAGTKSPSHTAWDLGVVLPSSVTDDWRNMASNYREFRLATH